MPNRNCLAFILTIWFSSLSSICLAVASCQINILETVNFGAYDPLINGDLYGTGEFAIHCQDPSLSVGTSLLDYTLKLSPGSSQNFQKRTLIQGNSSLTYNLFTETTHTQIWGDGTQGTQAISGEIRVSSQTVSEQRHTVYGLMRLGQNASVGAYSDSITITLDF